MQINRISNINFRENKISREAKSENAILMLRDPNASVRFQQSQDYARKADSVDTNPVVALGYKLYRTFNMLKSNEANNKAERQQLNKIA